MTDNKFNILYVDDEEFNLTSFKAIFRRDYNVFTATSGKLGLEILKQNEIHLIITDQRMPDMTGVEFLESVAEDYMFVRRIIITGFSDIEAIIRAINKGNIYRYITKPWDVNDLKITIQNALNAYKTDRANRDLTIELQLKLNTIEELTAEQIKLQEEKFKQEAEKKILEAESEKLKEIQTIREELSNMIVHDLKNPLGLVIGYAKMAEEQLLKPEIDQKSLVQFVKSIQQAGNNMLTLVLNILDVYRFENGKPSLRLGLVPLSELVETSLERVSFGLEKKIVTIVREYDSETKVNLDKELVSRVMVNLLTNSLKFTTKEKRFWIGIKEEANQFIFSVRDEGSGIPEDKLDQLFKRFSQLSTSDDVQGIKSTGIGLTFVKYAVEAHSGKVWVESVLGEGTTFFFSIPKEITQ
ncbi:MAG: hybrid sensor histidine kinase/response regulator [Bacteroidetes bacterium]|nr:hybrid sensor histidine kinase/response regulator [Bacteroidota bacterium]